VPGMLIYALCVFALIWLWTRMFRAATLLAPAPVVALMEFYWVFWPAFLLLYGLYRHWIFALLFGMQCWLTVRYWSPYRTEARSLVARMMGR
jgi:hypothetical protein